MKHADVLVSPLEKRKQSSRPSNDIVASAKTIAILKQQPGVSNAQSSTDPLQQNDPWQSYVSPYKQPKTRGNDIASYPMSSQGPSMEIINRVVDQKVEAKIAMLSKTSNQSEDAEMEEAKENRIAEMEHRLSSLESVVQTHHAQQVQQQSQVAAQITSLQQRVDSQGSALQRHLDEKLSEQLSQIERLLGRGEKKPRGE